MPHSQHLPEGGNGLPSEGAVLLLAGLSGAFWLATAVGCVVTWFLFITRHEAHGAMAGVALAAGALTLGALVIALVCGFTASSKLRRIARSDDDAT